MRQTILCCSHVNWWMRSHQTSSNFHRACPREQQCSLYPLALWCVMSRTLLYKDAAWGWIPVTSAMITRVSLHYWWLYTCPFITDANHLIIILNPKTSRTHCTEYLANEVNVVCNECETAVFICIKLLLTCPHTYILALTDVLPERPYGRQTLSFSQCLGIHLGEQRSSVVAPPSAWPASQDHSWWPPRAGEKRAVCVQQRHHTHQVQPSRL